jgi:hypothetical protein
MKHARKRGRADSTDWVCAAVLATVLVLPRLPAVMAAKNAMTETDCVAGHIGFELRCAERRFISLTYRVSSDSDDMAQTLAVSAENNLLC